MLELFIGLKRLLGWQKRYLLNKIKSPTVKLGYLCSTIESEFEEYVTIGDRSKAYRVKFGCYTYCGENCLAANVDIGRFCSIGSNVRIGLWKHPINYVSTSPVFYSSQTQFVGKPWVTDAITDEFATTVVGSDVWIGDNALIVGGVHIGHGAVIGAGSVVTKDIPPYAVVGGVPAKIIRYRFEESIIKKLQDWAWWDWPVDRIRDNMSLFQKVAKPCMFSND